MRCREKLRTCIASWYTNSRMCACVCGGVPYVRRRRPDISANTSPRISIFILFCCVFFWPCTLHRHGQPLVTHLPFATRHLWRWWALRIGSVGYIMDLRRCAGRARRAACRHARIRASVCGRTRASARGCAARRARKTFWRLCVNARARAHVLSFRCFLCIVTIVVFFYCCCTLRSFSSQCPFDCR